MFNFNQLLQTQDKRNARFLGEIKTESGSKFVVVVEQGNADCVYLYDRNGNSFHKGLKLVPREPDSVEKTFVYIA